MIECVFVFPCIRHDFIATALETLYKNTPIEFRVVVVDQTRDGLYSKPEIWSRINPLIDMYLRVRRNLGFAKAMNEGIIHGLHWGAKFVAACNDDIEVLDSRWWQGILDQFEAYPEMMAVNPASVIEPGWGYGIENVTAFKCPDWGTVVGKNILPKKLDGTAFTYEEAKTKEGYDWLINDYKKGHIEGFAGWFVVGRREMWEKVGLYDERFYPGGGEDYNLCHRVYMAGSRASATMRSWMWHWWGKSKEIVYTSKESLPLTKPTFQNVDTLFVHSPNGANSPIYPPRDNEPFGNKRTLKSFGIFADDIR